MPIDRYYKYEGAGSPALLAQVIKLLKDNDISSPVRAQKVADELAPHLPDFIDYTVTGVPH